jgi:hypothetical protein
MANRRRKPGPFSRDQALMDVDRRTRAGRVMKTVIRELTAHIGDASPAQRLLIQATALKATRLALLVDELLTGPPPSEGSDAHALAWMNAMRHDLVALGLERKGPASIDLHEYLKTQAEAAAPEVAPEAVAAA